MCSGYRAQVQWTPDVIVFSSNAAQPPQSETSPLPTPSETRQHRHNAEHAELLSPWTNLLKCPKGTNTLIVL